VNHRRPRNGVHNSRVRGGLRRARSVRRANPSATLSTAARCQRGSGSPSRTKERTLSERANRPARCREGVFYVRRPSASGAEQDGNSNSFGVRTQQESELLALLVSRERGEMSPSRRACSQNCEAMTGCPTTTILAGSQIGHRTQVLGLVGRYREPTTGPRGRSLCGVRPHLLTQAIVRAGLRFPWNPSGPVSVRRPPSRAKWTSAWRGRGPAARSPDPATPPRHLGAS
jgi:hypothetical protein